jgi:hypothetical protein
MCFFSNNSVIVDDDKRDVVKKIRRSKLWLICSLSKKRCSPDANKIPHVCLAERRRCVVYPEYFKFSVRWPFLNPI